MKTDKYSIDKRREKLKEERNRLESTQLNGLRELLPDRVIKQICDECEYYFRIRLFTPLVTIFHMLGAAISREGSFQSAWHNTGEVGRTDALARARKRLPLKIWQGLDCWTTSEVEKEFGKEGLWQGHRVIGIDGSCFSMEDEEELVSIFGRSGSKHGKSRFPIGRVVFAFMLNTMTVVSHKVGSYKTSENSLFSKQMSQLLSGDLIIGDRGFAGAKRYREYMQAGLEFITRAHQQLKVELLTKVEELGHNDFIVELPISAIYRRKDPTLPESIRVRMVKTEARIREKETFWLVTSLLDAKKYPVQEIKMLYKKRWKVEGLIEEIKIWLSADVLRSKTEKGIYKEMYARVIAFNLTHWLILKAAKKHQKSPEKISFSTTLRLVAAYSLKMSLSPFDRLPLLYEELLEKIANAKIPYRPDRIEPRLKKRDQKHYSILKISRTEWRTINGVFA